MTSELCHEFIGIIFTRFLQFLTQERIKEKRKDLLNMIVTVTDRGQLSNTTKNEVLL